MKKSLLYFITIFTVIFVLTGCVNKVDYNSVSNYSDETLTSALTSMNELDYDKFSSYLSDDLKESYNLATFQSETTNIMNKIGTFESLTYYDGEERNGYISLIYDAKYSNSQDTVSISITFKKDDKEHKIYQLYFDSAIINN
ncbi:MULTISPECIES: DUF3887 domain-containing protein [Clostridium]|uniref:DUF3887 domain-containing protein n=1 Tax=Clostridium cibarium TaxID=2762247 RepID=A0ABR8PY83_9CLOT|nr:MULTISPECIES: DUF3887 domain-containing protein [Clostridium]MBD7913129.1 DUF3887 domain-containing protein [Clostridium cibarium]